MEFTEDRKRYQFTQEGVIGEGRQKSGGCNRERGVWVVLCLVLAAALIGVIVYFTQNYSKNSDTLSIPEKQTGTLGTTNAPIVTKPTAASPTGASSSTTHQPPSRSELLQRLDCIPEAMGNASKANRELCSKRFCIYDDTGEPGIPVCYFCPDLGYRVQGITHTNNGFRVDLEKKQDGPFGRDIEEAVFEVQMLGNDLIRFTVSYQSLL